MYMNAPRIFDPLTMYDCDMPVDGCGAFVLTSAQRARDLPNPPAYIRGYGLSTATGNGERFYQAANLDYMREAGASLARALYTSANLTPSDIQAAMLYDGFSSFVPEWLEVLGFSEKNEGWRMISDGSTNIDGSFPVNTNGGCQGEGRTHGPGQISEAVYQIRGSAGPRQAANIENVVVTCGPPILQGSGLILSRGN
jgi:acetyl-CoA acetyltransferase